MNDEDETIDFCLRGEIIFEALDLDDAFLKLALHFLRIAMGEDSHLINAGEIDLRPNGTKRASKEPQDDVW